MRVSNSSNQNLNGWSRNTVMTSSENDELAVGKLRSGQVLPMGATRQDATEWLRSCGVIVDAVQAGEMIPDFELVSAERVHVSLGNLLDLGPVVITFILGSCSPICRKSLRMLQGMLPAIQARHGALVGISPDPPSRSQAVAEEDGLGFDLLTDDGHQLARLFGLTYQPPEPVAVWLNLLGLGAPPEAMSSGLVLPATYVVDSNGIAAYAFLNPDPGRRADPFAVLKYLSQMPREPAGSLG